MMPSSLIQHRTEARHSGRLSPGSTPACADQQDWLVIAPQILASNLRSDRSRQHARPRFALKPSDRHHRLNFRNTHADKKSYSTRCTVGAHIPRFRALALFGRRLSERGDGLGIPASENLHRFRHAPNERDN
jgi:hypothetical protein